MLSFHSTSPRKTYCLGYSLGRIIAHNCFTPPLSGASKPHPFMKERGIVFTNNATISNKGAGFTTTSSSVDTTGCGKIRSNCLICLVGPLGSGKTTFVQGVVSGVKAKPLATSPSFKLINEYPGQVPVYHFDLYRLKGIKDLENLGYREYFYGEGVTVIEWAEKIKSFWPKEYLVAYFRLLGEKERKINFVSYGKKYKKILKALGKTLTLTRKRYLAKTQN